jgi:uncharacterized protein (DUF1786 family)
VNEDQHLLEHVTIEDDASELEEQCIELVGLLDWDQVTIADSGHGREQVSHTRSEDIEKGRVLLVSEGHELVVYRNDE